MTTIGFEKTPGGVYTGFHVNGHAGYADPGRDIVCAAVSMLVINTVNSIDLLTEDGEKMDVSSDEKKGTIDVKFSSPPGEDAALLISSLELGVTNLAVKYGEEFIKII